tara:strand:+ start:297 stop:491 length:195 start_codon:yes stop_codon:yes gene_type:complete
MNTNNNIEFSNRKPNIIGAATILGIICGTAIGGIIDNFEICIPISAFIGLIVGYLINTNDSKKD